MWKPGSVAPGRNSARPMSAFVPFWFIVIAILWIGFFVLEGFDFGVGMLHQVVGTDEPSRRAVINTIGPSPPKSWRMIGRPSTDTPATSVRAE